MRPVSTPRTNFTYRGPAEGIEDLPCQRRVQEGGVFSTWELSEKEREAIAAGANIELGIYGEPIPPVSLAVDPFWIREPQA